VAKLGIVVEEIDESVFWLELMVQAGVVPQSNLADLLRESNELCAIFVRSQLTAKGINSSIRKSGNPSIPEGDQA
jgi:hypothetical protein